MQFNYVKKTSKLKKLIGVLLFLLLLGAGYFAWQFYSMFGLTMPSIDKCKTIFVKTGDWLKHKKPLPTFLKVTFTQSHAEAKVVAPETISDHEDAKVSVDNEAADEQKPHDSKQPTSGHNRGKAKKAITTDDVVLDTGTTVTKVAYAKIKITISSFQAMQPKLVPATHEAAAAPLKARHNAINNEIHQAITHNPVANPATSKPGQDLRALLQKVQRSSETQQVQRMQNMSPKAHASLSNSAFATRGDLNSATTTPVNSSEPIVMINDTGMTK